MKKSLIIFSSLALLFGLVSCGQKPEIEEEKSERHTVNIININDLHGALFDEAGHASISELKSDIDAIENEDDEENTIVVGNGDMFQGTALSNLSYGRAVIDAMNVCGFDIMGIGNHEFDWGIDKILEYFDGNEENGESTATLVNSNIYHDGKILDNSVPYAVLDLGFVKVGVVSYAPSILKKSILKSRHDGYDFRSIDTVKKAVDDCRKEADIVIANTHYGDSVKDDVNYQLAALGVDAILDGHFHREYDGYIMNSNDVRIPVVQTKDQLKENFGLIKLTVEDGKVVNSHVRRIKVGSKGHRKDPKVEKVLNDYYKIYEKQITMPLCVAEGKHYKSDYQDWASRLVRENTNSDIGVVNHGGIRNIHIKDGQTITYSDIFDLMPFDNRVWTFSLTGQEISLLYLRDGNYSFRDNLSLDTLDDNTTYKISIIDYVALQSPSLERLINDNQAIPHELILREMMVNELKEHSNKGIKFNPKNDILTSKNV